MRQRKRQMSGHRRNCAQTNKQTKCAPISHKYSLGQGTLIGSDPAKWRLNDDGISTVRPAYLPEAAGRVSQEPLYARLQGSVRPDA